MQYLKFAKLQVEPRELVMGCKEPESWIKGHWQHWALIWACLLSRLLFVHAKGSFCESCYRQRHETAHEGQEDRELLFRMSQLHLDSKAAGRNSRHQAQGRVWIFGYSFSHPLCNQLLQIFSVKKILYNSQPHSTHVHTSFLSMCELDEWWRNTVFLIMSLKMNRFSHQNFLSSFNDYVRWSTFDCIFSLEQRDLDICVPLF